MDLEKVLLSVKKEVSPILGQGKVADYIPELSGLDPSKFGMAIETLSGESYSVGDAGDKFTIQSISKVISLSLCFSKLGEKLWERVGVEPTGNPFNSLVQLEYEKGKPRNPLINAGALVVCDILLSESKSALQDIFQFLGEISGEKIEYNPDVFRSEKNYGHINRAMVDFMKGHGNIKNATEDVLDMYFHLCSIEMDCSLLARTFLYLANHGVDPGSGKEILSRSQSKRLMALMLTCGFYDEAGEFAFKVGLPGKSGVGGGIVAIIPGKMCIAVWSPGLNDHGNSLAGIKALELFTTQTGLSIF